MVLQRSGFPGAGSAEPTSVLVIDDDVELRETVAELLHDDGFAVSEAADGRSGLALLEAGLCPDVILLDHRMPGMTGGEVHDKIRYLGRSSRVVLVTAAHAVREIAERHKIPHYLGKPFGVDDLRSVLRAVLGSADRS